MNPDNTDRVDVLDFARFFAAIFVVFFHYTFNGIYNGKISSIDEYSVLVVFSKYGYLGVEFFFMISGYVIFFSAANSSASTFALSRIKRLYPSYWFAIFFTSIMSLIFGHELMSVSLSQVFINLTMLQSFFGVDNVDGVYWTLVYELKFYFLVFFVLFLGLRKHLESFFLIWPLFFVLALFFGFDSITYLGGHYYYFAAGAIFAVLKKNRSALVFFSLFVTAILCIIYSSSKAEGLSQSKGVYYSSYIISLFVISFFCFFSMLLSERVRRFSIVKSQFFGGLTYPIYLLHAHFGYMFVSHFSNITGPLLAYILAILIVFVVSVFSFLIVERSASRFWGTVFGISIIRPIDMAEAFYISVREKLRFKLFSPDRR